MKRVLILIMILLLIGSGFFVWLRFFKETPIQESTVAQRGSIASELTLSGEIDAEEKATLHFQTSGQLAWIGVRKGDRVKAQQPIASLDQRKLRKTLAQKLNTFVRKRLDFDQSRDDFPTPLTDQIERTLKKSQLDLENTVLDVELQDLSLQLSTISTPITGIVTRVDAPFAGMAVRPNDAFTIVNPDTLFFRVSADQEEVTDLYPGQSVTVVLDAFDQTTISGTIQKIAFTPSTEEAGTVYAVDVLLNLADTDITPRLGMTGDATFILEEKEDVLLIPSRFLNTDERGTYVYVGEDRKKVYVETGIESESMTEILQGLSEGMVVYD